MATWEQEFLEEWYNDYTGKNHKNEWKLTMHTGSDTCEIKMNNNSMFFAGVETMKKIADRFKQMIEDCYGKNFTGD